MKNLDYYLSFSLTLIRVRTLSNLDAYFEELDRVKLALFSQVRILVQKYLCVQQHVDFLKLIKSRANHTISMGNCLLDGSTKKSGI